jgi:hypothetical protein
MFVICLKLIMKTLIDSAPTFSFTFLRKLIQKLAFEELRVISRMIRCESKCYTFWQYNELQLEINDRLKVISNELKRYPLNSTGFHYSSLLR